MSTQDIAHHESLREECPCDSCYSHYRKKCNTGLACRSYFLFVSTHDGNNRPRIRAIGDTPQKRIFDIIYAEEDSVQVGRKPKKHLTDHIQ